MNILTKIFGRRREAQAMAVVEAKALRMALAGDLVSQREMFDLMEATWPRLSKNLGELKDAVASMEFTIDPWAAKGKEPSADEMKPLKE